jgi:molybdate transport system substrate-binding protein
VEAPLEVARTRLVIITPAADPGRVREPRDLARPGVRLALTAEQVPIGRYTRRALAKMSRPEALGAGFAERVTRNVVSYEANVRGLVAKVVLGELDAAIVYASDAVAVGAKLRAVEIPARYNEIAVYPAAVVAGRPNTAEARRFLGFLRAPAARRIFARYGFQAPGRDG